MSYILDALKKSEQERQRGDVPGLQTSHIPLAIEQPSQKGLYGFILLLLLVLAFVVGLLVADRYMTTEDSSGQDKAGLSLGESPGFQQLPSDAGPVVYTDPVVEKTVAQPVDQPVDQVEKPLTTQHSELQQAAAEPVPEEIAPAEVTAGEVAVPPSALQDIPYLHELPDYRQQSIPVLSFAGHVYSSSSLSRSVIINGQSMSEGDNIMQGMRVEQITPSGVVLSFQGELFRIDVLQDWSFE